MIAAIVASVALALAVCELAQAAVDIERMIARAEDLAAKGSYRNAIDALVPLEHDPDLSPSQGARVHLDLATWRIDIGEHLAGLRSADLAEQAARSLDSPQVHARIERVRGHAARNRGHGYQAVRYYEAELQWAQQGRDETLMAAAYADLSAAYQSLSDWPRVLYYADLAFQTESHPTDTLRAQHLFQMGVAYYEIHERDRAEQYFNDLLALGRRLRDRRTLSFAFGELGMLAWEFDKNRAKALEYDEQAIALGRALGVPGALVPWLINLGDLYRDTGESERALRLYREAFEMASKIGGRRGLPQILRNMGQVLLRLGRAKEAEASLVRAVEESDQLAPRDRIRWEARLELGQLYRSSDPARADRFFKESLELLEAQQSNVLLEDFRTGALSRSLEAHDPYAAYISFLLSRDEVGAAFFTAERAKARAFLDTLAAARNEIAAAVPEEYLKEETALLQQISEAQATVRSSPGDADRRIESAAAIERAEQQLTRIRLRLATENAALAQARYPRLWTAEQVQRELLDRDEALLMFFVGESYSAAWLVQRDRLDLIRLAPRREIDRAVRAYVARLETPSSQDFRQTAREVARSLGLHEILARLSHVTRLIIVPHGILHYLPFETLVADDGRYLIEHRAISYAPSVSSLAFLKRQPVARGGHLVAVGNPVTASSTPDEARRFDMRWVGRLRPLPFSGEEVRRIASVVGRQARVLEQDRATEAHLQQADLLNAAIVHIATHGLIDEDRPERSGLALTAAPPEHDGVLQVREIYRLKLRAALVTLSACQTALGKDVTGEGIIGLSRAFFYAGANAVVASLWNVSDASTVDWMGVFYEGLRRGEPIDGAARRAKLTFIKSHSKLQHPYYWAPFIVTGNAAISLPSRGRDGSLDRWLIASAMATAVVCIITIIARMRRRRPGNLTS